MKKEKRLTRRQRNALNPPVPIVKKKNIIFTTINLDEVRPGHPLPEPNSITEYVREDGQTVMIPPAEEFMRYDKFELREFYRETFVPHSHLAHRIIVFTHIMESASCNNTEEFRGILKNSPLIFEYIMDKFFPGRMEDLLIALQCRSGAMNLDEGNPHRDKKDYLNSGRHRENLAAYLISNLRFALDSPPKSYSHQFYDDHPDNLLDIWGNARLKHWQMLLQPIFRFPDHHTYIAHYHGHDRLRPLIIWRISCLIDEVIDRWNDRMKRLQRLQRQKEDKEIKLRQLVNQLEEERSELRRISKDLEYDL